MRVGAHVSIAGSLDLAIDRAVEIGAECIQIFGSAPQRWQFLVFPDRQVRAFRQKAERHNISPVFVHSIYLINLASDNPYILERSVESLIQYLRFANKIGAEGVVFHVGSHGGRGWEAVKEQVFRAVEKILERSASLNPGGLAEAPGVSSGNYLILENSAGAGGIIGARFSELGEIVRVVEDPRLRVCLDTAHAFESGYVLSEGAGPKDLSSQPFGSKRKTSNLDETLEEFDREIGLGRLVLIHANDSKTPLGSNVDRHENIGQGLIGINGFRFIVNHPLLSHLPFIIETPGFGGRGADRENIEALRRLTV